MSPSLSYTNLVYILHSSNAPTSLPREEVFIGDVVGGDVLGAIVHATSTKTLIAVTNYNQWRLVQRAINLGNTITLTSLSGVNFVVSSIQSFETGYAPSVAGLVDAKAYTLGRNQFFIGMRDLVKYPGVPDKPVIGLHGYKDQIYAVKDLKTVYFTAGNEQIFSNDSIRLHSAINTRSRVLDVHLLSGTYAGGDAAGVLTIEAESLPNGVYDIARAASVIANALTLSTAPGDVDMSSWDAGLYRSHTYEQAVAESEGLGWTPVDLGFTTGFIDGQSNGPFRVSRRGQFSDFDTDQIDSEGVATVGSTTNSTFSAVPVAGDSWVLTGGATVPSVVNADNLTSYITRNINNTDPNSGYVSGNMYLSNIPQLSGFSTSSSLVMAGLEVTVVVRPHASVDAVPRAMNIAVQPVSSDTVLLTGTSPQSQAVVLDVTQPTQTVQRLTFGGPTYLWGLDAATMKAAMDSDFGVAVQPFVQIVGGSRVGSFDIFYVEIKAYYTASVTSYYFWDGSDDVTADITSFFVTDGDWSTNDAAGTVQITNIQPVGGAARLFIKDGDEVRTDPNGGGLLVATIDGDMVYNSLDTLEEIEEAKSRYQFITANFYGQEDFEAIYGVSGAGRAFTYDGFYFSRIYTQADDSKDKPRHVAFHQFHLALGFRAGVVDLSVTGQPSNFDGVAGATEITTGDPVTGFARMPGTTLGIFCKDSIQGLIGTSIDNFSLSVLSPYEGAIEYTTIDSGNSKPLYCSYKGISIFDQTAAYGDFAGQRLSYPVTPFLAPRLQGTVSPINSIGASAGPVVAIACRTKSQYRLYFEDGYCLTMTLAGSDQIPMFTIQAAGLYDEDGVFEGYIVPRAESSFIDSSGAERIHIAHYSTSVPLDIYYVYELERSWTFDGNGIPAYVISNENFYNILFDFDNIRKLRLHGVSLGYAPIRVRVAKNYDTNEDTLIEGREAVDVSLPTKPDLTMSSDYNPHTSMGNMATRGRSFSMRFTSYDISNQPDTTKDPVYADVCPPFTIQAMLIQNTENKADV
jgi:hypothetical protein